MSEMLIIGAIALIVIGPSRLPQLARSLGKGMTAFKRASNEFKRNLSEEMDNHVGPDVQELASFAKTVREGVKNPGDIASALETAADVLEKGQKDLKKTIDTEAHDPTPDYVKEKIAAQKAKTDAAAAAEATDQLNPGAPALEAEAQAILNDTTKVETEKAPTAKVAAGAESTEEPAEDSEETNTKHNQRKS